MKTFDSKFLQGKEYPLPSHLKWTPAGDSLWSDHFQEAMHSSSGAAAETHMQYLEGCQIREKLSASASELSILEVGLGLGVGLDLTAQLATKDFPSKKIVYYTLENDNSLIKYLLASKYYLYTLQCTPSAVHLEIGNLTAQIIIGDAANTITSGALNHLKFDAIYFDPFSPAKCPSLWSPSIFAALYQLCNPGCILSTYSHARVAREGLTMAGFKVASVEGFATKKKSIRAYYPL